MEILFDAEHFGAECNDDRVLVRRHNKQRAKLIRRRLDDLRAAVDLSLMRNLPGRCHELKGNRVGQLSIDLDGPNRLVFRPAEQPPPKKADGGLDWSKITAIVIIEVTDTHE